MWGPVSVDGQPIHLGPPPAVGPYVTAPPGPLVPILEVAWLRVARQVAAEAAATAWLLAPRPDRPPPPRRRRTAPHRVVVADTPPVMLAWVNAGHAGLAGPEPAEPAAPGLAPIHAAAIARADTAPAATDWRPARSNGYRPLYDGLADPDPLDVAARHRRRPSARIPRPHRVRAYAPDGWLDDGGLLTDRPREP